MMRRFLLLFVLFTAFTAANAQTENDSLLTSAALPDIIQYALRHQPVIQKSLLDERITKSQVNGKLANWYPEVDFSYNLQHNFQLQTAEFDGQVFQLGNRNTSLAQFAYTQNIFNNDLLLAANTAKNVRTLSAQTTVYNKIDVVANVSKAFYNVLLTQQQIKVTDEDIVRLERSLKDARSRYENGIVDKTDYQRATISLNNAKALKTSGEEMLKSRQEYLKSLMGYPVKAALNVIYDSLQMESDAGFDVSQQVSFDNRIEYQSLQTQKKLQSANLTYTKTAFLPSIQGYAAYGLNYLNDNFPALYQIDYPNSYAGVTLAFPIIQGGKRWMNIRQAKWQLKKVDWDITNVEENINAEYAGALAGYNSSLAQYNALKENLDLAKSVYDIIQLQYRAGVKTYLEVITAEADLRTAQINYFNALYQLLSSKIDLQKALGQIKY